MTSYCSNAELVAISGSVLATTILDAIIAQADREIDIRLAAYGLSGTAGDATLKAASLKLSQAGLLDYGLHTGTYESTSGDFTSSVNVNTAIKAYQVRAAELLDSYIYIHQSEESRVFVRRVNGR